ncbi:MAG: hypothetical protein WAO02_07285 [Verrucomicrobiia bacterium]
MKKSAKLQWLSLGLCLSAGTAYAQALKPQPAANASTITNKLPDKASSQFTPLPPNSSARGSTNPAQPGEITTLDGKSYKGVTVQRVDPDGLTIGYAGNGGGTSIAKIKFKNLPEVLQRHYNYDPDQAAAYEAKQARGMAAWRAQQQKQDEAAKRAATQRAQQDALEQQQKELEQQQKKEAPPEMTEAQKQEAQKQIEATWSHMNSAVKAGGITN